MGRSHRRRKWPWILLFTAIALVALFYGGGAWYFAGQVHADALQATPYDPISLESGTVQAYDANADAPTVTLVPDEEYREETKFDAGIVGLAIGDTLVVAGPATREEDGDETRPVLGLIGEAPVIGDRYGRARDVWLTPAQAGLTAEEVVVSTLDGRSFPAWQIAGGDGTSWAILTHGKGAARSEMLRMARPLQKAGFTVLIITHTGDVGAPVYEDGMVHYGRTEWQEVEASLEYAEAHGAQTIVLGGASHGGAVNLGFLARGSLAGRVDGMILDAPASSFGDVIDEAAEYRSLPLVGRPLPESLEDAAKFLVAFRYGVDYDAVDYSGLSELVEVPLLTIQGADDQTVPRTVNDRFMASSGSGTDGTYVVVDGAQHLMSWNVDPEGYEVAITDFLASLTNPEEED